MAEAALQTGSLAAQALESGSGVGAGQEHELVLPLSASVSGCLSPCTLQAI